MLQIITELNNMISPLKAQDMKPENDVRSPLKAKPLRNPGQSLQDQLDELLLNKFLTPFLVVVLAFVMAAVEWWRYLHPAPPAPWAYSIIALVLLLYCGWQAWRAWPQIRQLRDGRDGEKVVGQYLERLREQRYQVFHDVLGDTFNLDHIIIGPAGIFTIETKTYNKLARGNETITFDGKKILVNGYELDRDPVVQAKAQAGWLKALLAESTGKTFEVRPVIVFPGWFIEQQSGTARQIWVLEPKALPHFLANEPVTLSEENIKLASFHLSRYIRSYKAPN